MAVRPTIIMIIIYAMTNIKLGSDTVSCRREPRCSVEEVEARYSKTTELFSHCWHVYKTGLEQSGRGCAGGEEGGGICRASCGRHMRARTVFSFFFSLYAVITFIIEN